MNAQSPHKCRSTLKSAIFGLCSSLSPLVGEGGEPLCKSVGKADLLCDHLGSRQSREFVDIRLNCHPCNSLIAFAFRSGEVRRLLLDLDHYGGTYPLGMFPLFIKRTALTKTSPRLSVVSRRFVSQGSFSACWRQANVTPIPKGQPSSSVTNYQPIFISSVLS